MVLRKYVLNAGEIQNAIYVTHVHQNKEGKNINTINAFIVVEKEFIQKDYVIDIGSN